uniref:Retrotransposon gag domain-containing protein n=1 Tax=Nicotiana tabacum TaxID=4097 RepID=A0A1S3X0H0_TOBAC|nr:PREDICTED: uncharacterized protein LOC107759956 [Nicotiana tabacum]
MTLPVDSPISRVPTSESATVEENRMLRLRVMEMWDAWTNGKDPPKAIPGFPELSPRPTGTSNVPISHPNIPSGQPAISTHSVGGTSGVHLQMLMPGTAPNIFTAPLCSATVQHSLPEPVFDPWVFPFQKPVLPTDPPSSEITVEAPKQDEKYDGHGDPIAHLKKYCNQLRGAGGKEELLMAYFGESLIGIASKWYMDQNVSRWHIWDDLARDFILQFQYNIDIAPDRNSLSNLKKKPSESFGEYAIKWREQASRVKPPMDEIEMVTVFLQAQEPYYFQNMMSVMGKPFAEAIKIGDMVEHGLKTGRILSQSAIRETSQAIQCGSGGMAKSKTRKETTMAASRERRYWIARPQANRNQPPFQRNQPPHQNHYNPRPPQNNFRPRGPPKRPNYTPIGESYSTLLPKLVQMNLLQPIPPNRQNPKSPSYQQGVRCAYHSRVEGHDTNDCWTLKMAVENLIEQGKIVLRGEEVPHVTNNPLPAHDDGPIIGMISEVQEFDPALKAIIAIADAEKKPKAASKQEKGEKKSKIAETEQEKEIDVPKQASVVRGTIKPLWLNEPVVIGRVPQKPITDPAAMSYKGKEILGKLQETEEMCGAMRKMLHETHIVQSGEGTSTAEVSYTGPSTKLQNWKATPGRSPSRLVLPLLLHHELS